MTYNVESLKRRNVSVNTPNIKQVLPEHYAASYPQLIAILEAYYQFLDSDQDHGFNNTINQIQTARDIEDSTIDQLNLLFKEIGNGTLNVNYFSDPRFVARLLANFYRVKGSSYSAEGFFKAFYGIDAEISYPKRNVFVIDESLIGPDDLAVIQDGALYQTLSILIKSELPITIWGDLYRSLVHPAGFYLGSEVTIVGEATMLANPMPDVELTPYLGPSLIAVGDMSTQIAGIGDYTGILPSDSAGLSYRINLDRTLETYSDITVEALDAMYNTLIDLMSASSPTLDDSDDSSGMDISNTIHTMDNVDYIWYDSTP